ncbi:MAG: Grx4 family monothiol glutaredoxin [Bdellovibrionaceae bacterium]|jgi:monothiol glutaredoxin|nr:Grx4 family monothiol glutaredoxin [Pseudobdellovibrionaceae bacterium]
MSEVQSKIDNILTDNKITLFMKGTPDTPQCGFSAKASQILNSFGVEYMVVDVLSHEDIRQGIKEYGNWPTIPQLYVNKELIGGSDILMEMYETGELEKTIKDA